MPGEIRSLADRSCATRTWSMWLTAHRCPRSSTPSTRSTATQKLALLERILATDELASAIVFTRTKHRARRIAHSSSGPVTAPWLCRATCRRGSANAPWTGSASAVSTFSWPPTSRLAASTSSKCPTSSISTCPTPRMPTPTVSGVPAVPIVRGKAYTFVTDEDRDLVLRLERKLGTSIPRRQVNGIVSIPFPQARHGGQSPQSEGKSARTAAKPTDRRRHRRSRYRKAS